MFRKLQDFSLVASLASLLWVYKKRQIKREHQIKMLIEIDIKKLIEKSQVRRTIWSSNINHSSGKVILGLSEGENKLKWYMDEHFHKVEACHIELLFGKRGVLVTEPPFIVGKYREMKNIWNKITDIRNIIMDTLQIIFQEEYVMEELKEIGEKEPGKLLCKRMANEFIPWMQKNKDGIIEFNTNTRKWKMK